MAEEGGVESYSLIHRVSVWVDEKVLETDGGDDFTHNMNIFNATEGGKFYDMFILPQWKNSYVQKFT